jgi:hypothetical protein
MAFAVSVFILASHATPAIPLSAQLAPAGTLSFHRLVTRAALLIPMQTLLIHVHYVLLPVLNALGVLLPALLAITRLTYTTTNAIILVRLVSLSQEFRV